MRASVPHAVSGCALHRVIDALLADGYDCGQFNL
jgi:hypothetical protein